MTGRRAGLLTVITFAEKRGRNAYWACVCDCGCATVVSGTKLRSGYTQSCGCLIDRGRRERAKHRMTKTPEHNAWLAMRRRCNNPSDKRYGYYGGRGIRVCPEWEADFNAFIAHVGLRPSTDHSLDRIDPNGHYEPGNVRWATQKVQKQNKRTVIHVEIDGVRKPLSEWARQFGISPKLAWSRYKQRGWDIRKTLTTDPNVYHNNY